MIETLPPKPASYPYRILIGHGFHPGEPGMKQLYEDLAQATRGNLDNIILSQEEWESGERLVDGENLSLVTPDFAGTRAQRLVAEYGAKAREYDVAIHPHGTRIPGSELAIYGAAASLLVKGVASYLGLTRAIIRTQGIEALLPNTMSIEIGNSTSPLSVPIIQEKLLSMSEHMPLTAAPIEEYAYVGDVSAQTAKRLGLRARYDPLEPLAPYDEDALNHLLGQEALELFAFGWDATLFDDNTGFRGELVSRHPLPQGTPFYGVI